MILDTVNWIVAHWDKIVLVITTVTTLVQSFQISVLKKQK